MIDIKAIRAAAETATPGRWRVTAQGKHVVSVNNGRICTSPEHMTNWNWGANSNHIAIASPATVIALCDEIERLRKDAGRYQFARQGNRFTVKCKSATVMFGPNQERDYSEQYDAAIDAAMAASK